MEEIFTKPRWVRDLVRFVPLKSQFVLSGNVRDFQISDVKDEYCIWHSLEDFLALEFQSLGYEAVVFFDPVTGFNLPSVLNIPLEVQNGIATKFSFSIGGENTPRLEDFSKVLESIVHAIDKPLALVANFSSQLIVQPDGLSRTEHDAFTRAFIASQRARARPYGDPAKPFYNTVIWIVDKEGDLPDWMIVDNPKVRSIPISKPDISVRKAFIPGLLKSLSDFKSLDETYKENVIRQFVEQTDGFLLHDLISIIELARSENIPCAEITDAIRRYKIGVTEDPWKQIDRDKIKNGKQFVDSRVKGQDHAITHLMDIVKRAITGVGSSKRGGRPRGVVFLAGPTGVGKTELAKAMTSLLFGDENAYIRFDMSEFSAEHSDQRLIGAPPGYVGYDVGGELTNAVREKPFSVVLFDEIEKAHPRILDKFLQILDDGVLTSGRGDKVYFSETFIVFTSNLGIYKLEADGTRVPNVTLESDFGDVQKSVKSEIENHFKLVLNRPEILNRIGENVIVFDFIRPDIGEDIFDSMFGSIISSLQENQKIEINVLDSVKNNLKRVCLKDLSHGGRGIRNMIEAYFVNPLSRSLFDVDAGPNDKYKIVDISFTEATSELRME